MVYNLENLIEERINKDRNEPRQNGVDLAGREIRNILFKKNND
jgi:hypothetical protein